MPGWWSPPSGRTRRPRGRLSLPSDVELVPVAERRRLAGSVAVRAPYLVLLGALAWLTLHLVTAAEFRVDRPRVSGTHLVPAEQVAISSELIGQNVFLVNSRRAAQAALRVRPLRSVEVGYVWPNVVSLDVVERRPFAVWRTGDAAFQVSEDGVALAPSQAENLPLVVTDLDVRPLEVGGQVDKDVLADAAFLATALRGPGPSTRSFEYSSEYGLIAPTERGVRVAFGRGADLPAKVATLRVLLEEFAARRVDAQFVDLRDKARPYFR